MQNVGHALWPGCLTVWECFSKVDSSSRRGGTKVPDRWDGSSTSESVSQAVELSGPQAVRGHASKGATYPAVARIARCAPRPEPEPRDARPRTSRRRFRSGDLGLSKRSVQNVTEGRIWHIGVPCGNERVKHQGGRPAHAPPAPQDPHRRLGGARASALSLISLCFLSAEARAPSGFSHPRRGTPMRHRSPRATDTTWIYNLESTASLLLALGSVVAALVARHVLPAGPVLDFWTHCLLPMQLPVFYFGYGYLYQRQWLVDSGRSWLVSMGRELVYMLVPLAAVTVPHPPHRRLDRRRPGPLARRARPRTVRGPGGPRRLLPRGTGPLRRRPDPAVPTPDGAHGLRGRGPQGRHGRRTVAAWRRRDGGAPSKRSF